MLKYYNNLNGIIFSSKLFHKLGGSPEGPIGPRDGGDTPLELSGKEIIDVAQNGMRDQIILAKNRLTKLDPNAGEALKEHGRSLYTQLGLAELNGQLTEVQQKRTQLAQALNGQLSDFDSGKYERYLERRSEALEESGMTLEDFEALHIEEQEYLINGAEILIDPIDILSGGLTAVPKIAGKLGVQMIMRKGVAYVKGVFSELVMVDLQDFRNFVKIVSDTTGNVAGRANRFLEDLFLGKEELVTPEGVRVPINKGDNPPENTSAIWGLGNSSSEVGTNIFDRKYLPKKFREMTTNLGETENALSLRDPLEALRKSNISARKVLLSLEDSFKRLGGFAEKIRKGDTKGPSLNEIRDQFKEADELFDRFLDLKDDTRFNINQKNKKFVKDLLKLRDRVANDNNF